MRRLMIIVSVDPARIAAHKDSWGDFSVFTPVSRHPDKSTSIRLGLLELAAKAIEEEWDENVPVIQDDVYVPSFPAHQGRVTSYQMHKTFHPRRLNPFYHTCPRAFTATPDGWRILRAAWSEEGKACELWLPDYWYDVAVHLSGSVI